MEKTTDTPSCVGIIMDGNRRWAKSKGLPAVEGHRYGYEKFKDVCRWAKAQGVHTLIFYAFSTENWNRSDGEVTYLETLIERALFKEADALIGEGVQLRVLGQRERFSKKLQDRIAELEERSKHNQFTAAVGLSYGGRADILQATQKLIDDRVGKVEEATLEQHLWTAGLPDPDIIIRTSGEHRLSNFLTWQSVYSELFFTDTLWPDFSEEEFRGIVEAYGQRQRRKGT